MHHVLPRVRYIGVRAHAGEQTATRRVVTRENGIPGIPDRPQREKFLGSAILTTDLRGLGAAAERPHATAPATPGP